MPENLYEFKPTQMIEFPDLKIAYSKMEDPGFYERDTLIVCVTQLLIKYVDGLLTFCFEYEGVMRTHTTNINFITDDL